MQYSEGNALNSFDVIVAAGTIDARRIIDALAGLNMRVLASVATQYGAGLLKNSGAEVHAGRLDSGGFKKLIEESGAKKLVDATHPFAQEVSKELKTACKETGTEYLRFVRPEYKTDYEKTVYAENVLEAAKAANIYSGNIFLTTGSKDLRIYTENIDNFKKRLFVRVLPVSQSLEKCEEFHIPKEHVIAAKAPFGTEENMAQMKACGAAAVVTKDSGEAGGLPEKIEAARRLSLPVIIIKRPKEQGYGFNEMIDKIVGRESV